MVNSQDVKLCKNCIWAKETNDHNMVRCYWRNYDVYGLSIACPQFEDAPCF